MRRIRALGLGLALLVLPLIPSAASAAGHSRATVVVAYSNDGYYGYRDRDDYWRHHRRYRDRDDYYRYRDRDDRYRHHDRHYRRYHRDRDDWR